MYKGHTCLNCKFFCIHKENYNNRKSLADNSECLNESVKRAPFKRCLRNKYDCEDWHPAADMIDEDYTLEDVISLLQGIGKYLEKYATLKKKQRKGFFL